MQRELEAGSGSAAELSAIAAHAGQRQVEFASFGSSDIQSWC